MHFGACSVTKRFRRSDSDVRLAETLLHELTISPGRGRSGKQPVVGHYRQPFGRGHMHAADQFFGGDFAFARVKL